MLQPTNLHLLIGTANPHQAKVLDLILRDQVNLKQSLVLLSRYWKLKIWFSELIDIIVWTPCRLPTTLIKTDCHVFSKIYPLFWDNRPAFMPSPDVEINYCPRRNSDYEYRLLDCFIKKITKYEILLDKVKPIWR